MNCPLEQLEFCFQIASSCQSHLGISLDGDFDDFGTIDSVILQVRVGRQYMAPNAQVHTLSLDKDSHLPSEFETLFGIDPMISMDVVQESRSKAESDPVIMILHSIQKVSVQNQVYLLELSNALVESKGTRPLMCVCTFPEADLHLIHPQLLDGLLLCPRFRGQHINLDLPALTPASSIPKSLSVYIREIVTNLRHDPSFVVVALSPSATQTIERILTASGIIWSLGVVREYVPFILAHRLVAAPHLNAVGPSKVALILASISNVAIPP